MFVSDSRCTGQAGSEEITGEAQTTGEFAFLGQGNLGVCGGLTTSMPVSSVFVFCQSWTRGCLTRKWVCPILIGRRASRTIFAFIMRKRLERRVHTRWMITLEGRQQAGAIAMQSVWRGFQGRQRAQHYSEYVNRPSVCACFG